jgi:hypothetical protein
MTPPAKIRFKPNKIQKDSIDEIINGKNFIQIKFQRYNGRPVTKRKGKKV